MWDVHSLLPRSACCSPRPNADVRHAKTQTDPKLSECQHQGDLLCDRRILFSPKDTAYLHDTKDENGHGEPQYPDHNKGSNANNTRHAEHVGNGHVPQHLRQLGVCERQRPKTEVGGGVRDASKAELNSVDDLMDHNLPEIVMFLSISR